MFDVYTTGDTAHIDTIFKFSPHTGHMLTRVWQPAQLHVLTRGSNSVPPGTTIYVTFHTRTMPDTI